MKDLTVLMDLVVGRPAAMLEDAANEHVEIVAACLCPRLGGRVGHLAVDDGDVEKATSIVARHGGVVVDERECVVVSPNFPGGAAAASRAIADADILVNISYYGPSGDLVIGTPDVDATRAALGL